MILLSSSLPLSRSHLSVVTTATNHHPHHHHRRLNSLSSQYPTDFFPLNLKLNLAPNWSVIEYTHRRRRSVSSTAAAMANWLQDGGATAAVLVGSYGLVRTFDTLTQNRIIEQNLSRKLVHILSGLLFMISWPVFSNSTNARYFACVVPLLNCIRLLINGLSLASDEGLLKSVTREGKPEELLRGPLYYVLVLIFSALFFWRNSPIGIVSVAMMCAGDGIADIMGRRFGSLKLPYNRQKSFAGSISMFFFGFIASIGMLYFYSVLGYFQLEWIKTIQRIALVSLVATLVESLPINKVLLDDNLSVPLTTAIVAYSTFGV